MNWTAIGAAGRAEDSDDLEIRVDGRCSRVLAADVPAVLAGYAALLYAGDPAEADPVGEIGSSASGRMLLGQSRAGRGFDVTVPSAGPGPVEAADWLIVRDQVRARHGVATGGAGPGLPPEADDPYACAACSGEPRASADRGRGGPARAAAARSAGTGRRAGTRSRPAGRTVPGRGSICCLARSSRSRRPRSLARPPRAGGTQSRSAGSTGCRSRAPGPRSRRP